MSLLVRRCQLLRQRPSKQEAACGHHDNIPNMLKGESSQTVTIAEENMVRKVGSLSADPSACFLAIYRRLPSLLTLVSHPLPRCPSAVLHAATPYSLLQSAHEARRWPPPTLIHHYSGGLILMGPKSRLSSHYLLQNFEPDLHCSAASKKRKASCVIS